MIRSSGKAKITLTARIIHADGSVTELGELRRTWRSWPIIRQVRQFLWKLKHRS